jgi:hypothetical protein
MNDTVKVQIIPEISPEFDMDFIQADDILSEVTKSENRFPVEAFPDKIQDILLKTNQALSFPIDFTAGAMLAVASTATGNALKVQVKSGWVESCTMYVINIGAPGANKTHPTKTIIRPFFEHDSENYQQYKKEKKLFDQACAMSRKERIENGHPEPVKPTWNKIILTDFTPEALIKSHQFNFRSQLVYVDEAITWTGNFGRYNQSAENQFWLSNWSAAPLTVERKSDEPVRIESPFISVVGSIQPSMLHELLKDSRNSSGFVDRIAFVYPDDVKKESWNDQQLDPQVYASWKSIVNKILTIPCDLNESGLINSKLLRFNPEAWEILSKWQSDNTKLINEASEERIQSLYSKMEIFVIRISLILQVLRWASNETGLDAIESATVQNAIRLTEYFRQTALKVNRKTSGESSTGGRKKKDDVINVLPEEFTTGEGVIIANTFRISERTFKYWLKDESLFKQIEHGRYQKLQ